MGPTPGATGSRPAKNPWIWPPSGADTDGAGLGVLLAGLAVGRAAAGAVGQGQVTARRQAVQQPADDGLRFGVVTDVAQHSIRSTAVGWARSSVPAEG